MTRVLLVPDLPMERWPSMDRYASRLAAHLPDVAPDLKIDVASPIAPLTQDESVGRRSEGGMPGAPSSPLGELGRYLQRYLQYPARVRLSRADLVHVLDHSYAHMVRALPSVPAVVTVHDLLPVIMVRRRAIGLRSRLRNLLLTRVLAALREAQAWIVATEWLRGELSGWLEHQDRIHVVPYGVDDAFFDAPAEAPGETRERLHVPADAYVVLHVGSVVERKNVPAVIAGVAGLRKRGVPAWLLQVGGRFTDQQQADIAERGLESVVVQVAEAPERDLRVAYRAADVLLFPSHYEGFGLPLLEAMASGLPIVTSGAGALAEVAGDAAIVVASRDPERYSEALLQLASDPVTADDLRARGRARARGFRWPDAARRTAEVYRTLV
jgi:glycosyltransferase involved in cell wall biosynthesis